MSPSPDVKQTVVELIENLGTVGSFMLSEARAFLRRSWGASREEFMAAVDQIARNMKQSGKVAAQDIETAAAKIKQSWELLDKEKNLDWDGFLADIRSRLATVEKISQETFDMVVNQAKETLDKQWTAAGRLGEEQLRALQKQSELMAQAVKGQWEAIWNHMEKTGKRMDRSFDAAWEEWKKKD